jgi:ADP-heptose:LPS heptosyltransferase
VLLVPCQHNPLATAGGEVTRLATRARVILGALGNLTRYPPPAGEADRVLVAHHPQMIGDTLMLAPLFAKLRSRWPRAQIIYTASSATLPLFVHSPWGVKALHYDPYVARTLGAFRGGGGYDLAIVPGDNRYGWFARAAGARWVRGFSGERPAYKDALIDELHDYPLTPGTWGEIAAGLVEGEEPPPYSPEQWPAPPYASFEPPAKPYAVIQLGASSPLKQWPAERWRALADYLYSRGFHVAWTGGVRDLEMLERANPDGRGRSFVGKLDLAQLWGLLAGARVLVSPDTGVAHLGRLVGIPSVTLFGPGSHIVSGVGRFWREMPWRAVTIDPFPCRDQRILFRRRVEWVRRCGRTTRECDAPRCMQAITVQAVQTAVGELVP